MRRATGNGNHGRPKETVRGIVFALVVGAALFFCRGATAAEFTVTEAAWKPDNLVLYVEGTARHLGSIVLVRDAGTHALLGSAAVRTDGKWVLKIRSPKNVPPRVRAQLGSKSVEYAVAGAKSNQIQIARGATAAEFAVTEANWKPDNLVLYVEGTARRLGSVVLVRDAVTHASLGSTAVRADGKWGLEVRNPESVPSRVRAQLGSKSLEYAVARVGSDQIISGAKEQAGGPADACLSSPLPSGPSSAAEPPTAGVVVGSVPADGLIMPPPALSLAVEIAAP